MRHTAPLERIFSTYRVTLITVLVLVVVLAAVSLVDVFVIGNGQPSSTMSGLRLLGGLVLIALLWNGYRQIGRALREAEAEQQARLDSAHRDSLTGVFTRAHFLERMRQALRGGQAALCYLQIDMDNLKVLNDSHGHAAGDAALVHLTRTIREMLPDALVGRLGGDEFGIAIAGSDNRAAMVRLGGLLLGRLDQPVSIEGRNLRLSATIGLAMAPEDGGEVDVLMAKADLALYKGKKLGRATTIAFEADLLADERHKRFVERDLRAAILLNELELHYQPIYAQDGFSIVSHEALVRWEHPVRGQIAPGQFIPIAEQSDLIDKLGEWVLRRACRDWPLLGGKAVGINVSAVQLSRPDFATRFAETIARAGIGGRDLVIEVTESVPLQPGTVELLNIETLRTLGVRVAIDDFGAGFTSLEYLRRFPFDIIKIDRSYICNLPGSKVDTLLVSAICKIARSLGVEVIAEGVETREQLDFLRRAGCDGLQGFLLARPAPLRTLLAAASAAKAEAKAKAA